MSSPSIERPGAAAEKAGPPEVRIRQATRRDREALWKFMKAAYEEDAPGTVQYKVPRRWNWQFADNPFVRDKEGDDLLPIWIALVGDEIAGQMCAMPMRITIDGRTYDGGWGCDFIVLKKFRGRGVGWRLNEAYCRHFQIVVHVTQAHSTARMWERWGMIAVSPVSILWRIVRLDGSFVFRYLNAKTRTRPPLNRLFRALCRFLAFHHVLAFGLNGLALVRNAVRRPAPAGPGATITEETAFDAGFSAFIDEAGAGYGALVKREPRFLAWKYVGNPVVPYHLFVLRREGAVKGYIALRRPHPAELGIGIIADIFTAPGDTGSLEALLAHAVAFFGRSVRVIQTLVPSGRLAPVLKRSGFVTIKTYEPHFVCADPALRETLKDQTRDWYITFADHDQDQIRPVE